MSFGASRARGFTLIELMTVVVILAVLAAIAIPQYSAYVKRSYRIAARGQLLAVAQYLERVRSQNFSYGSSVSAYSSYLSGINADSTVAGKYAISISDLSSTTFTVSAAPIEGGPSATDECGTMSIDHRGGKGNSSGSYTTCWAR